MATLATPDIDAIVLVLAAVVDSTETMPHICTRRHMHVANAGLAVLRHASPCNGSLVRGAMPW